MEFFINYVIIPRTISGKIELEDQSWRAQNEHTRDIIQTRLKKLGVNISEDDLCTCVGFEGYGSLSWNRNLPSFLEKDYGINYWPLVWPESLIIKEEFSLSLRNINTKEIDTFYFRCIKKMADDLSIKVFTTTPKTKEKAPNQNRIPKSPSSWREIMKSYPEYKKWIKLGNNTNY